VRGAEAALYAAACDEPTCDIDQLVELLTGDAAEPTPATAWFTAVSRQIDEDEAGTTTSTTLTAVRLRFDNPASRPTASTPGRSPPTRRSCRAGTGVLVDGLGVPRVRLHGRHPAGRAPAGAVRPDPATTPSTSTPGRQPRGRVGRLRTPPGWSWSRAARSTTPSRWRWPAATRPSSGASARTATADRGVFTPTRDPGCQTDCHELGDRRHRRGGHAGLADLRGRRVDPDPRSTELSLHWGRTSPTTFRYSLLRRGRPTGRWRPATDLEAIYQAFFNDRPTTRTRSR
jgi:hypothetical protein